MRNTQPTSTAWRLGRLNRVSRLKESLHIAGQTLKKWASDLGIRKPPRLVSFRRSKNLEGNLRGRRADQLLRVCGHSKRYLEIGLFEGRTFEAVNAPQKVGVDPYPRFWSPFPPAGIDVFRGTSRDFFRRYSGELFDLIYLDGLHEAWETYLDFTDALVVLRTDGGILIDDVLPSDFESSLPDPELSRAAKLASGTKHHRWYGDVWRLAALLTTKYSDFDLEMIGSGVTEKGNDHGQLFVRPRRPASEINLDRARDRAYMEGLKFEEAIGASGALTKIATPETSAMKKILGKGRPNA